MCDYTIRAARLILVAGFVAVCLGSPIIELQSGQGKSCTIACLKKLLVPVCGSDGRTYKNPCMLNAQNCGSTTKIVEELYEGVCSAEPTEVRCAKVLDSASKCPEKIDPLCGEDVTTYLNYCHLLKSNCNQKVPIGVVHRGTCDTNHKGKETVTATAGGDPQLVAAAEAAGTIEPEAIFQSDIVHDTAKAA